MLGILSTISRPEFDSIFSNAIRPVIYELMRVSEEINAPASSFSYLFYFNANGVLDHARISIILAQEGHSLTIEYPDSILNHLLSNFSLGFSANRAYSQCGSTYLRARPHIPVLDGPKRYLLAYQPGKAQTVNGLAIGVIGHDVICNAPYNQTTNGINLQIGGGLFHWYKVPLDHYHKNSRMKNIIITGGAGFIGSHVVRLFVNRYSEYRIINVDVLTYAGNFENLKRYRGCTELCV
jgi:hypothetical protein